MSSLFSIAYLPPVSYLLECIKADEIILEQHEHFIKQTYRNRCRIYGPNGLQTLSIPVMHQNVFRTPMKDVCISYNAPWNKIHWKAITSAYRNSPFFEFYEDDFQNIFEEKNKFLFDFNFNLFQKLLEIFKIKKSIRLTEEYETEFLSGKDFRNSFHPKKNEILIEPYHQVFLDRHGFKNDLSVIDYLFNCGNELESRDKNQEPRTKN